MFYGGCNEFVINSVKAKRKISFVHCDFKHYFGHNKYNLPDKWYIDKDFVEKLFTEHKKLEEIKDDFK